MCVDRTKPLTEVSIRRRQVLCVDDAEVVLLILRRVLETKGYEVTTSTSAVRTAETLHPGEFELAVLDYEMPVMNGPQLAAQLKVASPDLKIILYTGAVYVESHELRFIDQMVHKSEGIPALLAAIEAFLPSCQQNEGERRSAPLARM